jgi:hypothetical protein
VFKEAIPYDTSMIAASATLGTWSSYDLSRCSGIQPMGRDTITELGKDAVVEQAAAENGGRTLLITITRSVVTPGQREQVDSFRPEFLPRLSGSSLAPWTRFIFITTPRAKAQH